ncbi:unnamed protein product [Gongylonema pulchrum]|uniref:ANK_REP_REGION domain-containing protein n=1 Tax=Gongylonema pulchrum TaxID=637853 RepID=A0A183D9H6_9BILA|nr:unnamed protein product [Gongylonema pulchrum]
MWAAMNGVELSIRTIIDLNPIIRRDDSDKHGFTALHLAAARDHVNVVNTLIFLGWDIEKKNHFGETPFIVAAKYGSVRALRALLDGGADYLARDKVRGSF